MQQSLHSLQKEKVVVVIVNIAHIIARNWVRPYAQDYLSKCPSPLSPQSSVQKWGYLWELMAIMLVYMQRAGDRSIYSSKHLKNSAGLLISKNTFNCEDTNICLGNKV